MTFKIDGKSIKELRKILEYPPYLIFVFISAVFVITTLITKNNFDPVWIFFLYSVGGAMWRYIERDFLRKYREKSKGENEKDFEYQKKEEAKKRKSEGIIFIYHLGNIGLFIALLCYLRLL